MIASNTKKTELCRVNGIPVIKADFIGSVVNLTYGDKETQRALRKDEDFLILKIPETIIVHGHKASNMAIASASSLGMTPELIRKISRDGYNPGDLPAVEELAKTFAQRKVKLLEIYIAKPIDCIGMVNRSLEASGSNKLDVRRPGYSLEAALQKPGMAMAWTRAIPVVSMEFDMMVIKGNTGATATDTTTAAAPAKGENVASVDLKTFLADAKAGDVICFLQRAREVHTLADARALEKTSDDRVIWLDDKNNPVDISGLGPRSKPGIPYTVGHTGIYSGPDSQTNEPLVAQSHVYTGTIVNEKMTDYMAKNEGLWDGVAVISHDFFAKTAPLLASKTQ